MYSNTASRAAPRFESACRLSSSVSRVATNASLLHALERYGSFEPVSLAKKPATFFRISRSSRRIRFSRRRRRSSSRSSVVRPSERRPVARST